MSSPGEAEPQATRPTGNCPGDRSLNPRLPLTPGVNRLLHFSELWVFSPEGGCGGSDTLHVKDLVAGSSSLEGAGGSHLGLCEVLAPGGLPRRRCRLSPHSRCPCG